MNGPKLYEMVGWAPRSWVLAFAMVATGMIVEGSPLRGQQPDVQRPDVAAHQTTDGARRINELLARPVTLKLTKVSLTRALDSVSRVSKVIVQYQVRVIEAYSAPVTIDVTNAPLGVVLEQVLDGTTLRVVPAGQGDLAVVPMEKSRVDSVTATGIISGRVVDSASGQGLVGATVKIQNRKLSTITTDSGRFTLKDVPQGDQLLFIRVFGYKPIDQPVTVTNGERTVVRISMVSVPTVLSGVVTTAVGVQRKIEVGNDITSLNVDSIRQIAPITSVTDLLEARVPGLTVAHTSGTPGDPARLRLRGVGSVQLNSDPIVIVNGIRVYAAQSESRNDNLAPSDVSISYGKFAAPSPLDQIDPNSIATIEVFKGPSASALYGSDAANGVIVITTKQGRAGPAHWDLALTQGVNWIPGKWPAYYHRFGYNDTGAGPLCNWTDATCVVDSVVAYQALNDPRYTVLSHGGNQQATLTVSGGVPTLTYSISGSATGQSGNLKLPAIEQDRYVQLYGSLPGWLVRPDQYTTWSGNGSMTARPSATLDVALNSQLFSSTQQRSSLQNAITELQDAYIEDGQFESLSQTTGNFADLATTPIISAFTQRVTDNQLNATNAMTVNWHVLSWLPISVTGGINTLQRNDVAYIPYGVQGTNITDTTGYYGLGRGTSHDQTLTANTTVPLFSRALAVGLGGNVHAISTADVSAFTNQLAPGVSTPTTFGSTGTNGPNTLSQATSAASTYGWYLEPRFNVASRFFVAPGFRLDGGSGGAQSAGSIGGLSAFPKLDFSWIAVDRQNARPLWGVMTLLRPRVAFGYAGTQPGPQYKLRLFNADGTVVPVPGEGSLSTGVSGGCEPTVTLNGGISSVPAVCLNSLGNTQLRPERTSELEGGVDATLWGGRLSVVYTRYDKTRHDAILSIPVASSVSGDRGNAFNIDKNIGVVRNTGTNLQLDAILLQNRTLSWHVGAVLSNDNNVVVRLNAGQSTICVTCTQGSEVRVEAGYPLFSVWAKPIVSFADANHNNIIDPGEIRVADSSVYVGQPNPKYQFNPTTDIALWNGQLSVHAEFTYQNGMTQNNLVACNSAAFLLVPNTPNTPLATQAAVVAAGCAYGTVGGLTPIGLIQTINTFRFQTLSINYELSRRIAQWFRGSHMMLALQGSNLGLHTNYRGKDPDVNAFSTVSAGDQTRDSGQIPESRTWSLLVRLGN